MDTLDRNYVAIRPYKCMTTRASWRCGSTQLRAARFIITAGLIASAGCSTARNVAPSAIRMTGSLLAQPVHSKSELIARLLQIADVEMQKRVAHDNGRVQYADSSKALVQSVIQRGVDALPWATSDTAAFNTSVTQSEANMQRLAGAIADRSTKAARYRGSSGPVDLRVTDAAVTDAVAKVCPLYPFC